MEPTVFLTGLFRTTLFLTASGIACWFALRKTGDRVPRLSRFLWIAVLLTGWFWVRPVVSIPWTETVRKQATFVALREETPPVPVFSQPPLPRFESGPKHEPIPTAAAQPVPAKKSIEWKPLIFKIIFAVWIGGMVVSIFLSAAGYSQFLLRLRKAVPAGDDFAGPWRRLLEEHGIEARSVPMFVSEGRNNLGPALVRTVFGYRLVVPRDLWSELSESGRCGILKHEREHFRRRDVWKSFFVRILALPHWFNPMAHLAVHRFEEAAELLCDRAAFECRREGVSEFAETLLLLHENAPTQFVARQSIFGRGLKHRVACLLHENQNRRVSTMKKTFLITGAVVVLAACLFRVEFTQKSTAQEQRRQNLPGAHHLNKRIESLPDATVELRLLVLDESGQPVQGAQAVMKLDGGMKAESTILALGETDSGGARLTGASDAQGRLNWKVPAPFILPDTYISVSRFDRQLIGGVSLGDTPKAWKKPEPFEVTARLIKARRITGIVVDAAGKPVENAMVNANFAAPLSCVSTDSQGRFVLDVSPYQPRESLFAYKRGLGAGMISPDYPLEEAWKAVGDGSDWDRWKKNRNDGPFTIKIERGETISVRVVDTEGNPIEGISVHPSYFSTKTSFWNMWNFNELFPCRTDKDGRVVFDWIPTQRYSYITFSAQGTDPRIDKEGKTRLYGAADAVWRDTLKNNDLLISLPKKITLEGSVRNADGSPPPVGMQISFTGKNWSSCGINTDYDGNFTFFVNADEIVSANPISNRSRNPGVGVGKALQNVDVGDGSKPAPRFDFVLEKGTKVLGKILAGNPEKPFEKMYVQIFDVAFDQKAELSDMNRVFGMIEVDEKGEYETRLPAGVYRFKVDDKEIGGTLEINGEDEKRFDLKDR